MVCGALLRRAGSAWRCSPQGAGTPVRRNSGPLASLAVAPIWALAPLGRDQLTITAFEPAKVWGPAQPGRVSVFFVFTFLIFSFMFLAHPELLFRPCFASVDAPMF